MVEGNNMSFGNEIPSINLNNFASGETAMNVEKMKGDLTQTIMDSIVKNDQANRKDDLFAANKTDIKNQQEKTVQLKKLLEELKNARTPNDVNNVKKKLVALLSQKSTAISGANGPAPMASGPGLY
jgi:hypothetical protein